MQAEENVCKKFEVENCAETVATLTAQFVQSFPILIEFLQDKIMVDKRIEQVVDLQSCQPITKLHYLKGHSPEPMAQPWYETVSALFDELLSEPDHEKAHSLHCVVFSAWSLQIEKSVHGLASYAKSLPGYSDLLLDDRIILLKQARTDIMNILK